MNPDSWDRVRRFFSDEDPADPPAQGRGRYEIVREIGRGGMSVVYEARDPRLGRRVALKVLQEVGPERARREAEAAARLRHPNVVTVHEVGPDYIVMDLVEGRTLAEALPDLDRGERLRILEAVAEAVAHAHAHGVIHRDLKPANVLLESGGRPVLTDFGLARLEGGEDLTRTGAVIGTPHYMAPEQVRGEGPRAGPPADVWALGVLLYEMLSDRRPFEGETPLAIYEKIVHTDPKPLGGDLGAIAARALEKDPARRYPDAGAMLEDLRRARAGEPIRARRVGPFGRLWRRARRRPRAAALVLAAAGGALAAGGFAAAERAARGRALEALRGQARVALEAALELRRQGANAGMRKFLPALQEAYREAERRAPGRAEPEYLLGRMYRALLEDDRALAHQERALARDPGYRPALYERAVLLGARHVRALKAALPSGETAPSGIEELEASLSALAALREEILRAARAFEAAPPPPGGDPPGAAEVIRGLAAFHERRYGEAREALESALARDPFLEEAREFLALAVRAELLPADLSQERAWKRAEELYTQGLERDRGYWPHLLERGQLRWMRGSRRRHRGLDPTPDYAAAEEDFARALAIRPESAAAETGRGMVRIYRGIYRLETLEDPREFLAAAEEDLTRALARSPDHGRAWMWRGVARFYRGLWLFERGLEAEREFEASEADLSEAERRLPEDADVVRWRCRMRAYHGMARARAGRDPSEKFAGSEEDFARVSARTPRNAWTWTWGSLGPLGRALWRQEAGQDPGEDYERAEARASRAVELSPEHMEGWKHRGFVRWYRAEHLEARGDRSGAREAYAGAAADFLRALSINPTLRHQIGDRAERARRKAADLGGS